MSKRKRATQYEKTPSGHDILALKGLGKDINLPIETQIPSTHPAGIPESVVEIMVKKAAGSRGQYLREDEPYLEQYLHPEHDILGLQTDRPTKGGPSADMPYRKLHRFPETSTQDESYNVEGLGRFKYDESNPAYDSIYDIWDFDTKTALTNRGASALKEKRILPSLADIEEILARQVMQRAGKPYTVYERVPKGTKKNEFRVR